MQHILASLVITQIFIAQGAHPTSAASGRYERGFPVTNGSDIKRRIIGGYAAGENDFPWTVLINKIGGDPVICTGSIVSKRWIVTAAHCILNDDDTGYKTPLPIGNTQIVVGCADLSSSSCTKYNIRTLVAHPCYTPSTDQDHDDIAMMEVDTDIQMDPNRFALVDGIQGTVPYVEGSQVIIAGFGMTNNQVSQGSSTLQRASIGIATKAFCVQQNPYSYTTRYIDFNNVICTGGPAGKDSCNGDSGGPIIFQNASGTSWLIGVLSKGSERPSEPRARIILIYTYPCPYHIIYIYICNTMFSVYTIYSEPCARILHACQCLLFFIVMSLLGL
jgi:secreted trypsin-like serine protease